MEYYLTIKKEWNTNACYHSKETGKHAKWKKLDICRNTQTHIEEFHSHEISRKGKSIETELEEWSPRMGQRITGVTADVSGWRKCFRIS